jgi:hypothetical protein
MAQEARNGNHENGKWGLKWPIHLFFSKAISFRVRHLKIMKQQRTYCPIKNPRHVAMVGVFQLSKNQLALGQWGIRTCCTE